MTAEEIEKCRIQRDGIMKHAGDDHSEPLSAISYFGGKKSTDPSGGVGRWVLSLLPADRRVVYVETHGGMIGCLLARQRSKREIVNDLNGRVINWWLHVRDHIDEFKHLLMYTPISEALFKEYRATIDEGTPIQHAMKFYLVVVASLFHGDGNSGGFSVKYGIQGGDVASGAAAFVDRIEEVRQRIITVQFLCRPALALLQRLERVSHAVIYVDPPYRSATATDTYAIVRHDYQETVQSLQRQTGRVAVSGYNDDWDILGKGWHRHEYPTHADQPDGVAMPRTEVLWTNYAINQSSLF